MPPPSGGPAPNRCAYATPAAPLTMRISNQNQRRSKPIAAMPTQRLREPPCAAATPYHAGQPAKSARKAGQRAPAPGIYLRGLPSRAAIGIALRQGRFHAAIIKGLPWTGGIAHEH